jgi:flagellar basal body-associated protein FliL
VEDIYPDQAFEEPKPKQRMSGWLIALIVIVVLIFVCCICFFLITLLFPALLGPAVGDVFSTIVETLEAATPLP